VKRSSALGISFRPAGPEDENLLFGIYASTRLDELQIVPWTDEQKTGFLRQQFAAQKAHYQRYLPDTEYRVIEHTGEAIGRLYLDRHDDELRIVDIALMTEHRGRGIGGAILSDLVDEAEAGGVPVRIHVERNNPALGLYRRLGFKEIGDEGVYLHMERATARAAELSEMV
jgi:ribosomal protein S18 acetylase RimI-like enzyme